MPTLDLKVTANLLKEREKLLKDIARRAVYVGIAESDPENRRKDGHITNAQLGFIHEFGSPARNIPARPVLEPGVARQKRFIANGLFSAIRKALEGNAKGYKRDLDALGLSVAIGVKNYMATAPLAPLKGLRKSEKKLLARTAEKDREALLDEILATRQPLIDTGALRDAIDSYVVKE